MRERSSAVFSNRYFVEVIAGIADQAPTTHDRLTVRMLAAHTGLTDSLVKLLVARLVNAELLLRACELVSPTWSVPARPGAPPR